MSSSTPSFFILLSGLVGALSGAIITWRIGVRTARISRTTELYKEFYSSALGSARIEAHQFVKSTPVDNFNKYSQMHEAKPLWEVIYFYQRLSQMRKQGLLLDRVIPEWFGETFVWWYEYCFRDELRPAKWKAFRDINGMYQWLEFKVDGAKNNVLYVPEKLDFGIYISPKDWEDWHERGQQDRAKDRPSTVHRK